MDSVVLRVKKSGATSLRNEIGIRNRAFSYKAVVLQPAQDAAVGFWHSTAGKSIHAFNHRGWFLRGCSRIHIVLLFLGMYSRDRIGKSEVFYVIQI